MRTLRIVILEEDPTVDHATVPHLDPRRLMGLDGPQAAELLRQHAVALPVVGSSPHEPDGTPAGDDELLDSLQTQRSLGVPMTLMRWPVFDASTLPVPLDALGPPRTASTDAEPSAGAELDAMLADSHARLHGPALSDRLTGLPGREILLDRLEQACAAVQRGGAPFSVLWIRLQPVRREGQAASTALPAHVVEALAQRLQGLGRRSDSYARMGPHSFAGLLPGNSSLAGSMGLANKIAESASTLSGAQGAVRLEVAIGVAQCPQHGTDARALLRNAHGAMEQARRRRLPMAVFDPRQAA